MHAGPEVTPATVQLTQKRNQNPAARRREESCQTLGSLPWKPESCHETRKGPPDPARLCNSGARRPHLGCREPHRKAAALLPVREQAPPLTRQPSKEWACTIRH